MPWLKHWNAFGKPKLNITGNPSMADLRLVHDEPPPALEQAVLRIRHDALLLAETMTPAQVRASFLILERARDDLSKVLDRCKEFKR